MKKIIQKIQRKWMKLRLQPIRVFCFHHVSDVYDPLTMWKCDWTQIEEFKRNIIHLQKKGFRFISMSEAQQHLRHDTFRFNRYIVLTADDGYKSMLNILPWLEKNQIPITLFINAHYMEGRAWSSQQEKQTLSIAPNADMTVLASDIYLSHDEVYALSSPYISVASHGYNHTDATHQTIAEFKDNITACVESLKQHPRYIPFHAFTWGHASVETIRVLHDMNLTPVLCSGTKNYNNPEYIDRLAIDGKVM